MSEDFEGLMKANDAAKFTAETLEKMFLDPTFVGHALICEAMVVMLGCDRERAHALANGFITIAAVDQKQYLEREQVSLIDEMIAGKANSIDVHSEFDRAKHLLKGSTSIPSFNWQRAMDVPSYWAIMG